MIGFSSARQLLVGKTPSLLAILRKLYVPVTLLAGTARVVCSRTVYLCEGVT